MKDQYLHIREMDFCYGSRQIFQNFGLETGETLNIISGPSGCGKTTLLKLIAGILSPIRAEQFDVPCSSVLILQDDSLAPWLSGWRNILLFTHVTEETVRSHSLFPMIAEFVDQAAFKMSFGQRRLIELVRAFLLPEKMMLLDEPLNFLDRARRHNVVEYMNHLARAGTPVILTTHLGDEIPVAYGRRFEFGGDPPHSCLFEAKPAT